MRQKYFFVLFFISSMAGAQELFVFTEPASNMPTNAVGLRISNTLMKQQYEDGYNYHLLPELMIGVNKNLMLHAEGFFSTRSAKLVAEGAGLYGKYRFLSKEDVHSHFRMAAYGRISINNSDIHQDEIEINGHNSGFETGIIATQLLHKVALSATIGYEQAMNNQNNKFPTGQANSAANYSFSFGKLMLPRSYTNYKQTNVNLMVEMLGQTLNGNGKSYLYAAPSLQFIFNSQARLDLAYRKQLYSSMLRTAPDGFLFRFEYLFFNALKKRS